jgi:hypothetical protein
MEVLIPGKLSKDRVLTEEFVSKFVVDGDKSSKNRSRNRGLE